MNKMIQQCFTVAHGLYGEKLEDIKNILAVLFNISVSKKIPLHHFDAVLLGKPNVIDSVVKKFLNTEEKRKWFLLLCGLNHEDELLLVQSITLACEMNNCIVTTILGEEGFQLTHTYTYHFYGKNENCITGGLLIKDINMKRKFNFITKNKLLGGKLLGIDKIFSEAERNDGMGRYGYNIFPLLGYDVHLKDQKRIFNHLNRCIQQYPDEIWTAPLRNFLDEYNAGKLPNSLLLPQLFENPILREFRRKYGVSYEVYFAFGSEYENWEYYTAKHGIHTQNNHELLQQKNND